MVDYKIVFYKKSDGHKPVEDFLMTLDEDSQAKFVRKTQLLQEFGPVLREPYSKMIKDGIFELRIRCSTAALRILYFFCVGKEIVMTNGFVKKTQKTPTGEIETAKKYRKDYLERKGLE